jgi:hypothetical protein
MRLTTVGRAQRNCTHVVLDTRYWNTNQLQVKVVRTEETKLCTLRFLSLSDVPRCNDAFRIMIYPL